MSDFEKVKEELPSKVKFYSSLTDRNISDKNINKFKMKTMKYYHDLYLRCEIL